MDNVSSKETMAMPQSSFEDKTRANLNAVQPMISSSYEENGVYYFTLERTPTCYANGIRRVILSEIPVCAIRTENEDINQCNFTMNTTRFHNEILKQRLSCIPIHIKDMELLPGKYILEVDMVNDTDSIVYVTTEHFRIKNKETGNYITKEETRRIFPDDPMTHHYIDFCRLRPKISDTIPGEGVKFTAEFSVACAKNNSMFNVVSKCSYMNHPDQEAAKKEWERRERELRDKYESITEDEIEFSKRNFELLDAERYFVPNSFDFVIQSIGIYENKEIVSKACMLLHDKMVDMVQALLENNVMIHKSETTMEHCYDVILENEDYTFGKILEHVLYERFYMKDKTLSFCGFKKMHPHNTDSVLRVAFNEHVEIDQIRYVLKEACLEAKSVMNTVFKLFQG
jgi:DNA-directed RNA polymerase subunit L